MNEKLKGTISMQDLMLKYEADKETLKKVRVMFVIDNLIYVDRYREFKDVFKLDTRNERDILDYRGGIDRKTPFTNEQISKLQIRIIEL
jgi:hypothetical protein